MREVLRCYRSLLRTCQNVFQGDRHTYYAAKTKAREEFLKNNNVTDAQKLTQLVADALEAEKFLRESVVQAVPVGEGTYRLRLTKDKVLADNLKPPRYIDKQLSILD